MQKFPRFVMVLLALAIGLICFRISAPKKYEVAKGVIVGEVVLEDLADTYNSNGMAAIEATCRKAIAKYGSNFTCTPYRTWFTNGRGASETYNVTLAVYANSADALSVEKVSEYVDHHFDGNLTGQVAALQLLDTEYQRLQAARATPIYYLDATLKEYQLVGGTYVPAQ